MEVAPSVVQLGWEDLNRLIVQANQPSTSAAAQARHTFTKIGLSRQYDLNCGLLDLLSPITAIAPEEENIKKNLDKAMKLLRQRNELLVVADSDQAVFAFVDQRKKFEELETTNPVLAAYFKEKKKEEPRKVTTRSQAWKTRRPMPYVFPQRPFRLERPAWAPEPLYQQPSFQYGYQSRLDRQPQVFQQKRQMCYSCGKFGHFFRDCKASNGANKSATQQ